MTNQALDKGLQFLLGFLDRRLFAHDDNEFLVSVSTCRKDYACSCTLPNLKQKATIKVKKKHPKKRNRKCSSETTFEDRRTSNKS